MDSTAFAPRPSGDPGSAEAGPSQEGAEGRPTTNDASSTAGAEIGEGSVLAGRFRLEGLMGKGGMGSVWEATHLSLKSKVAIKLIDPRLLEKEAGQARFMREAQAAAGIRSPHVVQIYDFGFHEDRVPFIAMELLEGESLGDRLRRDGALGAVETYRIIASVCRGMESAHAQGIVHRDLKPDNIFITDHGDHEACKVLDFGLAKSAEKLNSISDEGPTQTGAVMGTPFYMSPEQARDTKDVDWRTDLWAIGVITYQCLVGAKPFQGDSFTSVILRVCGGDIPVPSEHAEVPLGFDAWFAKACDRDLDARFKSAREMLESLRLVLGGTLDEVTGLRVLATSASTTESPGTSTLGRWLGLAAVVLTTGAVALALWSQDERTADMSSDSKGKIAAASAAPAQGAQSERRSVDGRGVVTGARSEPQRALETFERGRALVTTANYAEAVSALTEAYTQLEGLSEPDEFAQRARIEVHYHLGHARRLQSEAAPSREILMQARENLTTFISEATATQVHLELSSEDGDAELASIERALAEVLGAESRGTSTTTKKPRKKTPASPAKKSSEQRKSKFLDMEY